MVIRKEKTKQSSCGSLTPLLSARRRCHGHFPVPCGFQRVPGARSSTGAPDGAEQGGGTLGLSSQKPGDTPVGVRVRSLPHVPRELTPVSNPASGGPALRTRKAGTSGLVAKSLHQHGSVSTDLPEGTRHNSQTLPSCLRLRH